MADSNNTENPLFKKFRLFVFQKRTAMGMSQTDLAKAIRRKETDKTDRAFINKIETGQKKGLTFETMDRILTALKSDINFTEQ